MIPAQLIRALRQVATLTGHLAAAEEAAALGEAATHDGVLDLLGLVADRVEADAPAPPRADVQPAPPPRRGGRPRSLDDAQVAEVRRLAGQGRTNPEIAAAVGASGDAVQRLRASLGLSGRPGRPLPAVGLERVRELADGTRSDRELATALGVSYWSARTLRRQIGAPTAQAKPGTPPSGWQDRIRELHAEGQTVPEIAAATGWALSTVRQRLYLLRLTAHRLPREPG